MSFFTVLPKRFRDRLTLLFGGLTLLCVVGVVTYVDRIASKRITENSICMLRYRSAFCL